MNEQIFAACIIAAAHQYPTALPDQIAVYALSLYNATNGIMLEVRQKANAL